MKYANFLDNTMPLFSQFGNNIYYSDVVQICIDRIATEMSKLQPRHIYTDSNGMQTQPKSSINRLFKFSPNEIMTTKDFIERIIWLLYMNYNAFIYPTYTTKTDAKGNKFIDYTGFYPLNPNQVDFLQDKSGKIFIKFYFAGGQEATIAYNNVIHLRKKFSVNAIMGGGTNGQPDNAGLLKLLDVNETIISGLGGAVKASLAVRGILDINTMLNEELMEKERSKLDHYIETNTSGIVVLDLKDKFTPINIDPKVIDKDTMDFIQNKILAWYGVPLPIFLGNYNDDDYNAWYESTLNPNIVGLNQAFSKVLFTNRELQIGNEIQFYNQDVNFLSTTAKLNLVKTFGEQGLLSDNQKLAIFGYPPITGGERTTQSLNYVDKTLINDYQMKKAGAPQINTEGGNT